MLRTIIAKDMKSALEKLRAELGGDAVIVWSQTTRDGSVLVRATTDSVESGLETAPIQAAPHRLSRSHDANYQDRLVARLRDVPSGRRRQAQRQPFDRLRLLGLLRTERTPEALALDLAAAAELSGIGDLSMALARALDAMDIRPIDPVHSEPILLVGPNGSGKTTMAAKLAALARLDGRPVRLAATDISGAGAMERLETFAAHVEAELVVAGSPQALAEAVESASADGAFLIADSEGADPRGNAAEFMALAAAGVEPIAVISALTDAEEAGEMARSYAECGVRRAIVTNLDCARRRGTLLTLAVSPLALAHVSRSAYLAGGIEPITPLFLARAICAASDEAAEGSLQAAVNFG